MDEMWIPDEEEVLHLPIVSLPAGGRPSSVEILQVWTII